MSSNEYLIDAASRHAVFIQRYSTGVERIAGARIEEIVRELVKLIVDGKTYDIRGTAQTLYAGVEDELLKEILAFAEKEGEFALKLIDNATRVDVLPVDFAEIERSIGNNPIDVSPGRSITIRQALREFSLSKVNDVDRSLSDARREGLTQMQTVSRLRGIIPLQKTQVGALVRTANNAASTIAAFKTFEKNRDIFEGFKWVSTLDGRTSLICMARDGEVYPFSPESPTPPAHWGCRSVIIPKVKKRYDLFSELDGGRPSANGEVSARTTYGGWLKKQPKSFVDEALGKSRADLFRSGKVKIDGFTDPAGRVYSLNELYALNGIALE